MDRPKRRPMHHLHPMVLAGIAIALWSTLATLSVRLAHLPPFLLVGIALLVGALPGLPRWKSWRVSLSAALLGVYGLFGYHFVYFLALRSAPAVQANLINYLWPLLIVAMTPWFFPGTRLTPRHIVAVLCGFAGAGLIVTGGRLDFSKEHLSGYALALAAALLWSSYSLLSKRFAAVPSTAVGLFCTLSGVLSLGCHALFEEPAAIALADTPFLAVMGLGPTGAAFYLWDAALKRGDPRTIGIASYLTPLGSTALLVATGAGRFTAASAIGLILIIGGALLGTLQKTTDIPSPATKTNARSGLQDA
jgi:drug/metabolite transporter (DMT)-like permease